ncbi:MULTISPECIES: hypothetical protein [Bacillus]|uniref:hypothetical protein n=1 Tax=Bacillus TaxID=1386 RepID=UPI0012FF1FA0|nr:MULTISPECIES: hypothetical protein [Bacillus]
MILLTTFLAALFAFFFVSYLIKALQDDSDPSHNLLSSICFCLCIVMVIVSVA